MAVMGTRESWMIVCRSGVLLVLSRDGPKVVVRHRYSDFLKLHELIGKGTEFPVPKALIVTDGVKK